MTTKRLVTNAFLLTLLITSTFLKVNVLIIPFTMQLLVVLIIAFITNWVDSLMIFLTYIVMGLIGIPVFANGGGMNYIYLPSFGFVLGFLVMSIIVNIVKKYLRKIIKNEYLLYFFSAFIGLISLYLVGFFYALGVFNLVHVKHFTLVKVLELTVLPFILIDLVKCLFASYLAVQLKNITKTINK